MKIVKRSKFKCISQSVLASVFSLLYFYGVMFFYSSGEYFDAVIFFVVFLFLLVFSAVSIYALFKMKTILTIDENGVKGVSNAGEIFIEWGKMQDFYYNKSKFTRFCVGVIMKNPEHYIEYFQGQSKLVKKIAWNDAKYKRSPLVLYVVGGTVSSEKIYKLLVDALSHRRES